MNDKVKVAVVGASGYSGIEAVRILASHPFVELSVLTSEQYAGREVADVYRHLAGIDLPPDASPGTIAAIRASVSHAFIFAFRIQMFICAGLSLASAAVAWLMVPTGIDQITPGH